MIELDLAELARQSHAYEEAEARYGRALALLDPGDDVRRLVAWRGRGVVRYRLGRIEEALVDLLAGRQAARRVGDLEAEIEILLEEATALDWTNDAVTSSARVADAQALASSWKTTPRSLRAALRLAQGRSLFRGGRWAEACAALEETVAQAEALGGPGHETLLIALILLEVVLPHLGRGDDAAEVAERAVSLARAKGDRLHLASALNNRRNLLVARKDVTAAIADQRLFMELGRQLGMMLCEYFGEYNVAELLYQSGDAEAAVAHAERAVAFEERHPHIGNRPVAALLWARLLAFQGQVDEALGALGRIRQSVESALAAGRPQGALTPSEEVLAAMVELATRDASDSEWATLVERSARESLEQEPIEVVEMRALAALRRGRPEEARIVLLQALELASRIPNVMEPRLQRTLAALPENPVN